MAVTDLDVLKDATYRLLENGNADADGVTLLTPMFTIAQMVDALNNAQRQFIKDTAIVQVRTTIGGVAGTPRYTLPADVIEVRRVGWRTADNDYSGLTRADAWQADHGMMTWPFDNGLPVAYQDSTLPTRTLELIPTPDDVGQIQLLYTRLSAALTGLGVALTVPDDYSWVVTWGALAELLGQDGQGSDPERAAYCRMRYDLGVELVRLLMRSTG